MLADGGMNINNGFDMFERDTRGNIIVFSNKMDNQLPGQPILTLFVQTFEEKITTRTSSAKLY